MQALVDDLRVRLAETKKGGEPAVRRMLPLSLTFDHRVVNGGEAARFIAAMDEDLGRPR